MIAAPTEILPKGAGNYDLMQIKAPLSIRARVERVTRGHPLHFSNKRVGLESSWRQGDGGPEEAGFEGSRLSCEVPQADKVPVFPALSGHLQHIAADVERRRLPP